VDEATSARAALDLNAFSISNVKTLRGGFNEWVRRGEEVTKKR
jgi:3-mercaptopyruvate sulfurtransferase SseA